MSQKNPGDRETVYGLQNTKKLESRKHPPNTQNKASAGSRSPTT